MTNHEKYQEAFSAIHISHKSSMEGTTMKELSRKQSRNRRIAVLAACALLVCGSTVAYATDLGGIQRTIQIWIQGDLTNATLTFDGEGNYSMDYLDETGAPVHGGGGGVEIGIDGTTRPLTEEELMSHFFDPSVEYREDGTVWLYYFEQKIELTDKFEDGVCYVTVEGEYETLYVTVIYEGSYVSRPGRYANPAEFN